MITLKNHLILYDADCPMCKVYTRAFTATGMLDENGREAYQTANCPTVDTTRAMNEIALVDQTTGEVTYGIDSMFKVIGTSFPLFQPLFRNKPFAWLMRRVYSFISYNRRVIMPSEIPGPTFNLRYRVLYLIVTWLVVGGILTWRAPGLIPGGGPWREYLICAGQIAFQGAVLGLYRPDKFWDYLGNMMTISLAGALLLIIPLPAKPCFIAVVFCMFLEHVRRTKLLGLGYLPTITWILYRLIVLYAIS